MVNYLAIDIGGTFIKYGLVNDKHQLNHLNKIPTEVNHDQAIIQQIKSIVQTYHSQFPLAGIGISTAGIVDRERGEIIYAGPTILNYKGTNFKQELASFNLPVYVTNDVDSALLGELWINKLPPSDSTFCLTLGTGIGGALYQNQLISGAHFQANSIGYLLYDSQTNTNFEMRASTSALNKKITTEFGKHVSTVSFFDAAKNGDEVCRHILHEWTNEIAKGIAQIILIVDPAQIIIGGGISAQGDFLLSFIEEKIPLFLPPNLMKTNIQMATQQNNASLFGAVYSFFN